MNMRSEVLSRMTGGGGDEPVFLPDLTLWYPWHVARGSLPEAWRGLSMAQIARAIGVPCWSVVAPWRVTTPGVTVSVRREQNERILSVETPLGPLGSRWTRGPDGDWWQSEYPAKTSDDLPRVLEWIRARQYELDTVELEKLVAEVKDDGIVAVTIPRRPYAELLNDLLGWSDGLVLLGDPEIGEILVILEDKLEEIVKQIVRLPGDVIFSPDNLDGQFVSPRVFDRHFAGSYRSTMDILAGSGKPLIVHAGGPVSRLLKPLSSLGVTGVEGICGPPQGDTSLLEAREISGADLTLWGGIPQDVLTDAHSDADFERAARMALSHAAGDSRVIIGVSDKVPTETNLDRLKRIADLVRNG